MEQQWGALSDELGPHKILFLVDRSVGLRGIVVVDNVAAGPAIGGVRMADDVDVTEVARLARAMTFKSAAAGLPHGGAKAGIIADPHMCPAHKEPLIRGFARAIAGLREYIPGPDMGTDETCMAWVADEIGRAVGVPAVLGGIPLDTLGATGLGLAASAEALADAGVLTVSGARVAVHGFGAVGRHAASFLAERGAVVVAVADSRGAIEHPDGLDLAALVSWKHEHGTVAGYPDGKPLTSAELLTTDCDILIPAARPDVLTAGNAPDVQARVVLQGANICATPEAEQILHQRGIWVVPDFIANAGGLIAASVETQHGNWTQASDLIVEKITANTVEVVRRSRAGGITPREAAEEMARHRVLEAMGYRRRL
jgi:glutamate dehydrogenase/leucine dehydrogenase